MNTEEYKTDVGKVAEVWDGFAQRYKLDRRASTPDGYLVDLEVRTLINLIKDDGKLLDIGCGNGYADIKIAQKKYINIMGIDISPEMIKYADQLTEYEKKKLKGNVIFGVGNILAPDFVESIMEDKFDIVLTKRVLINILSWNEQKECINKIWRLLKPKGIYIMLEATKQGYEKLSGLREKFHIPKTNIRWHNVYLDEEKLLPFLKERFNVTYINNFSSTYYIGSRVIQPLILKLFGKEPQYDSFINRLFLSLPNIGNYGIQKLFVCRKEE